MGTGVSYEQRRLMVQQETSSAEENKTIQPAQEEEIKPVEPVEPIEPETESEPEAEQPAEVIPPEPVPAEEEKTPAWVETLIRQQEEILQGLKKVREEKPAPVPIPQPAPAPSSASVAALENLKSETGKLTEAVERMEKANIDMLRDSKNFQADSRQKMQRELDSYHKLFADDAFAPLLTEMANIYITCRKYIMQQKDEKIRDDLESILLESMEELFEDNGVEIETSKVGSDRSLRRCKTRKTVPTGDEAMHGKVAVSYNPSFTLGRNVLVKEIIDTFVYDPALKVEPEQPAETPAEPEEKPVEPAIEQAETEQPQQEAEQAPAAETETAE